MSSTCSAAVSASSQPAPLLASTVSSRGSGEDTFHFHHGRRRRRRRLECGALPAARRGHPGTRRQDRHREERHGQLHPRHPSVRVGALLRERHRDLPEKHRRLPRRLRRHPHRQRHRHPGLFDMDISTEDARKEVVKCIEMSKDGIHAMLMVFSAASRFSREEHDALESIKLFFGDKILDHIILVFTHGDEVGDEVAWKKMLTVKSLVYLQEMVKLCQNRVVLFDNKTNGVEHREMQRRKLLAAVDLVISSNGGKAFTYQMLPQIQEANKGFAGENESSVDEYSSEKIYEQLMRITKTADEKLNSKEEQIRRLTERLDKFQKEHDSVKREVTNAEKLRRLDEEKMVSQKKEINSLRKEVEKARLDEMVRKEKEIQRLMEKLDLANKEKDNYKAMYDNKCIVM